MLIYYLDPKLSDGACHGDIALSLASALSLVGIETEVIIQGGTRAEIDGHAVTKLTQRWLDSITDGLIYFSEGDCL